MADAPYGYVIVHEPMASGGLHLAVGIECGHSYHGPNTPSTPAPWPTREIAEERAARARERFPDSRFLVCVLVPVEAGIQQRMTLDSEAP